MKKLLFLMLLVLGVASCKSDQYVLSESELKVYQFELRSKSVYRGPTEIARLTSLEWEYYNGDIVEELSLELIHQMSVKDVEILLRFLHTKFPDKKIEVNMDHIWDEFQKHEQLN